MDLFCVQLLLLMSWLCNSVYADYIVDLEITQYQNRMHALTNGSCCDPTYGHWNAFCAQSSDACDNYLVIREPVTGRSQNFTAAPIPDFWGQNDKFSVELIVASVNDSASSYLTVEFWDEDTDDHSDLVTAFNVSLIPTMNKQLLHVYTGHIIFFWYTVRVIGCDMYFYGPTCSNYCKPRDDDVEGHYECDSNGEKLCIGTYVDPNTNCTRERDPCSDNPCKNGGTCIPFSNDYNCTCTLGYEGENCTMKVTDAGCHGNQTNCNDMTITDENFTATTATERTRDAEGDSIIIIGVVAGLGGVMVIAVVVAITASLVLWARRGRKELGPDNSKDNPDFDVDNPWYAISAMNSRTAEPSHNHREGSNEETPCHEYELMDMEANPLVNTPTHHNGSSHDPAYDIVASTEDTMPESEHACAAVKEGTTTAESSTTGSEEIHYYASLDTASLDTGHLYTVLEGQSKCQNI